MTWDIKKQQARKLQQQQAKRYEAKVLQKQQNVLLEVHFLKSTDEDQKNSMNYKLELKPAEMKKGQKYKIMQITDLTFHSPNRRPTKSIGEKVKESFNTNEPGRIYQNLEKIEPNKSEESEQGEGFIKMTILNQLHNDPSFIKMIQEEEAKGYKVLLSFPKSGVPIYAGKDSVELMESKKGQRLLRRIAKEKKS